MPDRDLAALETSLRAWTLSPSGTEGYAKAEVTLGGIDTEALSPETMQATTVPGLFVIGEAVDVTGWLGGYNFQWAWASGVAPAKPLEFRPRANLICQMQTLAPAADTTLSEQDRTDLHQAMLLLEENHLVTRIAGLVGKGMERLLALLPSGAEKIIQGAVGQALRAAAAASVRLVDRDGGGITRWGWIDRGLASPWFDKAAVALTGAGGGAAGLAGTAVELPVTTTMIFRAIAQIAQAEGEDIRSDETRAECLKVFAFGGGRGEESEIGYYAVRIGLADLIAQTAGRSVQSIAPRLVAAVATRFGVPVTWKFAGQAIPGVGAAAGAMINVAFMDHFQHKARGHFTVRRLERTHGAETVRLAYEAARSDWMNRRGA